MVPVHPLLPIHPRQHEQHPYRIDRLAELPVLEPRFTAQISEVGIHVRGRRSASLQSGWAARECSARTTIQRSKGFLTPDSWTVFM
jgi:hypothetical protein